MNIITLIPVKNEAWILESTLENCCRFSDYIIVADQMSTDGSREICKKFPKVILIDNPGQGHSNSVRWLLLDKAREIEGDNLIFCIDADEIVSPFFFSSGEFDKVRDMVSPGDSLSFPWIQLWKSTREYRDDGVWKNSLKEMAFFDDRKADYNRTPVINDHTSRIPILSGKKISVTSPLLHLQFASWERTQIKQAWYRCSELVANPENAKKINHKYSPTLDTQVKLTPAPTDWLKGAIVPELDSFEIAKSWHYRQIIDWFDQYSIEFFEGLQIWHIEVLHDQFIKRVGREPRVKRYPSWLVRLNDLKNAIIKRT